MTSTVPALNTLLDAFPGSRITEWIPGDDLGDHAVAYALAGWQVLPVHSIRGELCSCGRRTDRCDAAGKHPRSGHGKDDATGAIDRVGRWWARWPDANIGAVVHDSLVVVDLDPRNGSEATLAALEGQHGTLPETLTCLTGGGGEHRYFRNPGGRLAGKLGQGIDMRLAGKNYTILPPSGHLSGGRYRWAETSPAIVELPEWVVDIIRRQPAPPRPPRNIWSRAMPAGNRIDGLVRFVETAQEGNRNNVLNWAAWRACEAVDGDAERVEVAERLRDAAIRNELSEGSVKATIESAGLAKAVEL